MSGNYENVRNNKVKKNSSMLMRSLKFWGQGALEGIGITVIAALAILLFLLMSGTEKAIMPALSMCMLGAGCVAVLLLVIGYFQVYISMLVSMNVTRKMVITGLLASVTATVLGNVGMITLCQILIPGKFSAENVGMITLSAVILFIVSAVSIILGGVMVKWGKVGSVLVGVISGIIGGCVGAGFVIAGEVDNEPFAELFMLMGDNYTVFAVIGVIVYAAAAIFAAYAVKKMEVRV